MEFCWCGCILSRGADGKLVCRKGHVKVDIISKVIASRRAKEEEVRIARLLTFPDPDKAEVVVFRLKNPFNQPTGFRQVTGENTPTFAVYKRLASLEERYPPNEFRRIVGSPWAAGDKENKFGIILCIKQIVGEIREQIEQVILRDDQHFTLEPIDTTKEELKAKIAELKDEMQSKLQNH